jgi:hypothetical protein
MEEKNQRAIEFLSKKSDLKKGKRGKETFFYKNTQNVKIRILCTGMDFYCESEKRKQYGWSDFVKQNDATPYKKNNEWLAVKDQNTDTETQCSLLYELFDKWQSFQSASEETQPADAKPKVKKDCETVPSDDPSNTDPFFPSSNFDMSRLEEFGEKEMLNGISDLEYKFENGKLVEDVYGKPINFASWGNWKKRTSDSKVTSNLEFSDELLQGLQPNIVFCGLNVSTDVEPGNWNNFHKEGDCGNSNLRDSIIRTRLRGAYLTDLIKFYPETAGGKVKNHFKNNKGELERHAEWFVEEMIQLKEFFWKDNSKLPLIIIVIGKTATKSLFETAEIEKKLREKFKDVKVYFACTDD